MEESLKLAPLRMVRLGEYLSILTARRLNIVHGAHNLPSVKFRKLRAVISRNIMGTAPQVLTWRLVRL
jgi:hypothetical protein